MTEQEWLSCQDPMKMLEWLLRNRSPSDRKLRLYACAAMRAIWHLVCDDRSRCAVHAVEMYLDGQISEQTMIAASIAAGEAFRAAQTATCQNANRPTTAKCAAALAVRRCSYFDDVPANITAVDLAAEAVCREHWPEHVLPEERGKQAILLRDIFGPLPFRSFLFNPVWRNPWVLALAQITCDQRRFDHLPVLATTLEQEGCNLQELLEHLRSPGPHYLGTWSLDLVLGKG